MNALFLICGLALAGAAAVRSTWSPCGLSMLSSLTPLAETGRGHRYRSTAAWFMVGGLLGGATLGAVGALGAIAWRAVTGRDGLLIAAAAAAVAVASDLELAGFRLPVHHRQVNERWLDQFRPWVYGIGFGFQIGTGLATYIMTAALYLLMVIMALSGSPRLAVALGAAFGLVRGAAVLLGRRITTTEALLSFHRRFSAVGPVARVIVIAVEGGCGAAFLAARWTPPAVALGLGLTTAVVLGATLAPSRLVRPGRPGPAVPADGPTRAPAP